MQQIIRFLYLKGMQHSNSFSIGFFLLLLLGAFSATAQDDCSGLTLVGIYPTHPASQEVTVVLTKVGSAQGQGSVYTSIQLVTNSGDTLLVVNECPCYSLPQVAGDTFAYKIQLYQSFAHFDELPLLAEGNIITEFPSCSAPFTFQRDTMPDLPTRRFGTECDDYELIGMYAQGYGNSRSFRALIGYNRMDSLGSETGYTRFAFENAAGTQISGWTGFDYYMPTFHGDVLSVLIYLDTVAMRPPPGTLLMEAPTCSLAFRQNTSSSGEPSSSSLRIYPNPTADWLLVESKNGPVQLVVRTLAGQIVLEGLAPLYINALPNGIYNTEVSSAFAKTSTQLIVISR